MSPHARREQFRNLEQQTPSNGGSGNPPILPVRCLSLPHVTYKKLGEKRRTDRPRTHHRTARRRACKVRGFKNGRRERPRDHDRGWLLHVPEHLKKCEKAVRSSRLFLACDSARFFGGWSPGGASCPYTWHPRLAYANRWRNGALGDDPSFFRPTLGIARNTTLSRQSLVPNILFILQQISYCRMRIRSASVLNMNGCHFKSVPFELFFHNS